MNKTELERELMAAGVNPRAYSLNGGHPDERYVLNQRAGTTWEVYYSERGQETGLRRFDSEDEACRAFLERVLRDPASREKGSWG